MSSPAVLCVNNLGKRFNIYSTPWHRAAEWAMLGRRQLHDEFWAVRDVSFEIGKGEFLGILGANGAGKSTLLKMITGALIPTEGDFTVEGRVLSLLEMGIGINDSLTGRQNVLVSTQLLRFPEGYAQERMAAIKDFSELGDFFERPVAMYSTGMRMRLAFSLFAFLECDVLILDEVMAVGDIFFQQKCFARLDQLIAQKTSIIMVTHDINAIQHYCRKALVMQRGEKIFEGDAVEAIKTYIQSRGERAKKSVEEKFTPGQRYNKLEKPFFWPAPNAFMPLPAAHTAGNNQGRLLQLALCNQQGQPTTVFKQGESALICFEFEVKKNIGVPVVVVEVTNPYNILIHSKNSLQQNVDAPLRMLAGDRLRVCQQLSMGLQPGNYTFSVGLLTLHPDDYENVKNLSQQDMNQKLAWVYRAAPAMAFAITFGYGQGMALTHGGLADLAGNCQIYIEPVKEADK